MTKCKAEDIILKCVRSAKARQMPQEDAPFLLAKGGLRPIFGSLPLVFSARACVKGVFCPFFVRMRVGGAPAKPLPQGGTKSVFF